MDDLAGLSWTEGPGSEKRPPMSSNSYLLNARSTPPISGRSTPLSTSKMRSDSPSKPSTTGNDSFAKLVNFGTGSSGKNLSLAERQRQLADKKALEEKQRRAQYDAQYGGGNNQFWDTLEKKGGTENMSTGFAVGGGAQRSSLGQTLDNGSFYRGPAPEDDEDDLLAAFNASAPVDKSTNFPIPNSTASPAPSTGSRPPPSNNLVLEDDDPFGLGEMGQKGPKMNKVMQQPEEDDDILGLLAKPVSEFVKPTPEITSQEPQRPFHPHENTTASPPRTSPMDRAVAELVDMGFPAEKAAQALAITESGTDVQTAVSWLLNQAHAESREKARGRSQNSHSLSGLERLSDENRRSARQPRELDLPVRTRDHGRFDERSESRRRAEKDAAQLATEFGNNLFKSANSLWKTGTKRVQQAVQDFHGTPDPSMPRWMRESHPEKPDSHDRMAEAKTQYQRDNRESRASPQVTDEAMMLEMERAAPSKPPRPTGNQLPPSRHTVSQNRAREFSSSQQPPNRPRHMQEGTRSSSASDRSRLSRLAADEQASQAYISPARRRKHAPPQVPPEAELDLLEGSTRSPAIRPTNGSPAGHAQPPPRTITSPPIAPRPKAPPRRIPAVSHSSLLSTHKHRQEGLAAYKRGDYAAAHTSYSLALSLLPGDHPVTIILLTNHALTALKVGEPKVAISDADRALSIIGPSKGESEKIDLGNDEPVKEMREFFGKAMMRKAEALEQLERWADAAKIWRETVEAGHGGNASIQGRTRCEKAAGIGSSSAAAPTRPNNLPSRPPPRNKPTPSPRPVARPSTKVPIQSAEAVNRLRAANEAADRIDNEKFALADTVEARLTAWKGGKQDNLRALLASLDTVLWPEAGWKKLSMAELVLPNKVKINYMKGISKVHPDKVSKRINYFFPNLERIEVR